jgi:hypothetical protein
LLTKEQLLSREQQDCEVNERIADQYKDQLFGYTLMLQNVMNMVNNKIIQHTLSDPTILQKVCYADA